MEKTWEPEAVLALIGGIVAAFFFGNLAAGLLRQAGVAGFKSDDSLGSVLLATSSFQGAAVVLGTIFLKTHDSGWREVLGGASWKRCLALAAVVLAVVAPVIFGLKAISEILMQKLHWPVADQRAVELILSAKTPWLSAYMVFLRWCWRRWGRNFFSRPAFFHRQTVWLAEAGVVGRELLVRADPFERADVSAAVRAGAGADLAV